MWRKVMEAQTGKTSTRDLTTSEVSQVFDILNQYLSSKGINVGFPER
jgi:phage gp16-like protein